MASRELRNLSSVAVTILFEQPLSATLDGVPSSVRHHQEIVLAVGIVLIRFLLSFFFCLRSR